MFKKLSKKINSNEITKLITKGLYMTNYMLTIGGI